MLRTLSFSITIGVVAGLSVLRADEPMSAPKPPESTPVLNQSEKDVTTLWTNALIVHDLAEFDFSSISTDTTGAWIVARIQPGGMSGSGYYSPQTGPVILVGGRWKLVEVLSGKAPPREGRFQWQEPEKPLRGNRDSSMMDMVSVFTSPSAELTVICQFFADKKDADQFATVTCIPDEWKTFVDPAREYHTQLAEDLAKKDVDELRKLASGENPFIALSAIRQLISKTTTEEAANSSVGLAQSLPRYRRAVLILELLNRNDDKSHVMVLKAIDRAKNTAELTGTALGIFTWSVSHPNHYFAQETSRQVIDRLQEKWKSLDPTIPDDWNGAMTHMVVKARIPQQK